MKKYLAIIFFVVALLGGAMAQDPYSASGLYDIQVNKYADQSYAYYNGSLANGDTIGVGDSIWSYTVYVKTDNSLKPKFFVDLDSIGGIADTVYVDLRSKPFPESDWTVRERSTWITGLDTQITLSSDSAHDDNYWQFYLNGQNDSLSVLIDDFIFKFWEGQ